jgi:hypothetical protein
MKKILALLIFLTSTGCTVQPVAPGPCAPGYIPQYNTFTGQMVCEAPVYYYGYYGRPYYRRY